jgi:prephenate dehydrogenase
MAEDPPFSRIGIVGLGLIGGSIARAARIAWPGVTLIGFDRMDATAAAARRDVVDATVDGLPGLDGCDLVILATPLDAMIEALPALGAFRRPAVITDVGSTKRQIVEAAAAAGLSAFVAGHPMAGSERGGLDEARGDLFSGRPWFLVHGRAGDETARRVEAFVVGLGAVPHWTDADTHDRAVAYLSHLPQIVAVALMNAAAGTLDDRALSSGGRAFDEMTRLASSPADLWHGILSVNADFVAEALADFMAGLPDTGEFRDATWVRDAFDRAAAARARMIEGRSAR